jgi:hypothetical protein
MVDIIDARSVRWLEYVDEATLGTTPTNPVMTAFPGDLIKFSIDGKAEFEEYKYFRGPAETDPLSTGKARKTGEEHTVSVTLKPSSMAMIPYALCAATKTTYAPGIVSLSISIGAKIGTEWCLIKGCVLQSLTLNFKDTKSVAEMTLEYIGMSKTEWGEDYKGTGSHGTAPTSAPYTMASISNILYDAAAPSTADLNIESLKVGISNSIDPVFDVGSVLGSKIAYFSYNGREMPLELGASCLGVGTQDDAIGGAEHTLAFTLGGKTYTFSNVVWTNAPSVDADPESKIGMSLSCSPGAVRLAIA